MNTTRPPVPPGPPAPQHPFLPQSGSGVVKKPVPDDVAGAFQAWIVTVCLQAAYALVNTIVYWLDPMAVAQFADLKKAVPNASPATASTLIHLAALLGLFFAWIVCGLFAVFVFRMRAGKKWARFVLLFGSVFLAAQAFTIFFSQGDTPLANAPWALQFIAGALTIFSATAAIAGVVLASTKKSLKYFGIVGKDRE